jgi:hypothetical protein
MPLFTSVVRQYTPPTCTLEVKARESALSRWVPLKMLNQLSFELRFDDPRQPQENQVLIWGDREDLESLYDAVTTYVQDFLEQSPTQMPSELWVPATASSAPAGRLEPDNGYNSKNLLSTKFNSLSSAGDDEQSEELEHAYPPEEQARQLIPLAASPYLQPRGLVAHDLFLGPLETEESGPVVTLSVTQLFDLATALDEYATDLVALPEVEVSEGRRLPAVPIWTYVAAGVVVAGAGLTLAAGQMLKPQKSKVIAVAPSPESSPTDPMLLDPNASPVPSPLQPTPLGQGSPSPTPLPTSSSAAPLGQPPSGLSPLGQPPSGLSPLGQPPSGLSPLGQPPSGLSPLGQPSSGLPPIAQTPIQSTLPPAKIQQPSRSSSLSRTTIPTYSNPSIYSRQPSQQSGFSIGTAPAPRQSKPPLRVAKIPNTTSARPTSTASKQPRTQTTPKKSPAPEFGNSAPLASNSGGSARQNSRERDLSTLPQLSPSNTLPPIATAPDPFSQSLPSQPAPSITANAPFLGAGDSSGLQERSNISSDSNNIATGTLLDTIPQVGEARDKLQQQWKPPQGLSQSLQYTLVVGQNGSIQRVIALGDAARKYINSTGMPRLGEPFVSPLQGKRNANIRVDLNSDGKVNTYLVP